MVLHTSITVDGSRWNGWNWGKCQRNKLISDDSGSPIPHRSHISYTGVQRASSVIVTIAILTPKRGIGYPPKMEAYTNQNQNQIILSQQAIWGDLLASNCEVWDAWTISLSTPPRCISWWWTPRTKNCAPRIDRANARPQKEMIDGLGPLWSQIKPGGPQSKKIVQNSIKHEKKSIGTYIISTS